MEPSTTGGAGVAAFKAFGGVAILASIGAGLAALVVMCMTQPRCAREWAVGITSTVVGSVCGGAAVIRYFEIHHWVYDEFGLIALIGIVFACGLPAWALVRWVFNYIAARQAATITDIAGDARKIIGGGS